MSAYTKLPVTPLELEEEEDELEDELEDDELEDEELEDEELEEELDDELDDEELDGPPAGGVAPPPQAVSKHSASRENKCWIFMACPEGYTSAATTSLPGDK